MLTLLTFLALCSLDNVSTVDIRLIGLIGSRKKWMPDQKETRRKRCFGNHDWVCEWNPFLPFFPLDLWSCKAVGWPATWVRCSSKEFPGWHSSTTFKLLMKKSQNWGTCWIAPGSVQVDRLLTDFLIYTWTFNVNPHMLRRTPSPPYKLYKTLLIFFT